jgi:hypothetical protein
LNELPERHGAFDSIAIETLMTISPFGRDCFLVEINDPAARVGVEDLVLSASYQTVEVPEYGATRHASQD